MSPQFWVLFWKGGGYGGKKDVYVYNVINIWAYMNHKQKYDQDQSNRKQDSD